jgi:hypothetical protein
MCRFVPCYILILTICSVIYRQWKCDSISLSANSESRSRKGALQNVLTVHSPLRSSNRTLALLLALVPNVKHEIPYILVIIEFEGPGGRGTICELGTVRMLDWLLEGTVAGQ